MAKEKFYILAIEETEYWQDGQPGDYYGYRTLDQCDPRFIADTFTVAHISKRAFKGANAKDQYRDAIWEATEEAARDLDANGLWADICSTYTYRQYQREQAEKRHAENRPPCAGNGEQTLPLFVAAAKRAGRWNFEALREIGWI